MKTFMSIMLCLFDSMFKSAESLCCDLKKKKKSGFYLIYYIFNEKKSLTNSVNAFYLHLQTVGVFYVNAYVRI